MLFSSVHVVLVFESVGTGLGSEARRLLPYGSRRVSATRSTFEITLTWLAPESTAISAVPSGVRERTTATERTTVGAVWWFAAPR
jgi:hypothetical protein